MGAIEAPDLSYAALAPLLFVFGAACVGVLVEAFAPRSVRHPVQVAIALVGTVGALVATLLLAGTEDVTAGGALATMALVMPVRPVMKGGMRTPAFIRLWNRSTTRPPSRTFR